VFLLEILEAEGIFSVAILIGARILQLTCFILPDQYGHLLKPKTIWNAEGTPETHSLLEQILHLEPLEVSLNAIQCMVLQFDQFTSTVRC
jgi:hypothetical protein